MNFIGVDLHKKSITICVMDEKRKILARRKGETRTQLVLTKPRGSRPAKPRTSDRFKWGKWAQKEPCGGKSWPRVRKWGEVSRWQVNSPAPGSPLSPVECAWPTALWPTALTALTALPNGSPSLGFSSIYAFRRHAIKNGVEQ